MHVDHETANRALAGVLKHYRNQDRLEVAKSSSIRKSTRYDQAQQLPFFRH